MDFLEFQLDWEIQKFSPQRFGHPCRLRVQCRRMNIQVPLESCRHLSLREMALLLDLRLPTDMTLSSLLTTVNEERHITAAATFIQESELGQTIAAASLSPAARRTN